MSATSSPATWRSERGSDDVADHLHDVQRGLRREHKPVAGLMDQARLVQATDRDPGANRSQCEPLGAVAGRADVARRGGIAPDKPQVGRDERNPGGLACAPRGTAQGPFRGLRVYGSAHDRR
jgi:hypothetical protein